MPLRLYGKVTFAASPNASVFLPVYFYLKFFFNGLVRVSTWRKEEQSYKSIKVGR